jgi:hypothetical protein
MNTNSDAQSDNAAEIAIRLRNINQLFNTLDPSPFREKDIDGEIEDFIVGWVRELPRHMPFRIAVHLPSEEAKRPEAQDIDEALAHYFAYCADVAERELRELFRVGRSALAIGIAVLCACLVASQLAPQFITNATLARIVEESLILVGWVANWRPIEIYLYDWWPIRRRAQLYRRIAAAPVIVKAV